VIFLRANGVERLPEPDGLEAVTLAVASGGWGKAEPTEWLRGKVGDPPLP
jgi:hypothetical protein